MPLRRHQRISRSKSARNEFYVKVKCSISFSKDVSEDIFSKDVLGEFCQLQSCFEGSYINFRSGNVFFLSESFLKVFKQMPQRRQASEFLNSFAGFNPAFLESENSSSVPHSFVSTW